MTETEWNALSPEQQANAWWQELTVMIHEAVVAVRYLPGNEHTDVCSGLTTTVAEK
jgi:hypothetical protein